jgi:hypothetical protein
VEYGERERERERERESNFKNPGILYSIFA